MLLPEARQPKCVPPANAPPLLTQAGCETMLADYELERLVLTSGNMADVLEFDEIAFFSLASLVCVHQPQQETSSHDTASDENTTDSEDWPLNTGNDSTMPDDLLDLSPKDKRLVKFLDHVAETFSREKSEPPKHAKRHERRRNERNKTKGKGARHVTASGLVINDGVPTIYVAKNGAEKDADEKRKIMMTDDAFARSLTIWIREIAITTERPIIENDRMWTELLKYYEQRLDIYASQIESSSDEDLTAAFLRGSDGRSSARELHGLSMQYKTSKSFKVIQRMVSIAYLLRYEPMPATLTSRSQKVRKSVAFLGRLRAAYETFKEAAIEFRRSFQKLTIVCLPAPTGRRFARSTMEQLMQELAKKSRIPQPKKEKLDNAWGKETEILNPCHAEIQLLLHFECSTSSKVKPLPIYWVQ